MKMKVVIIAVMALSIAHARPQNPIAAVINKFNFNNLEDGGYNFAFESSDGQTREESAKVINPGQENESIAVVGSYQYIGDDGQTYNVKYTADENGFQPEGEHLPESAGVKPKLGISSAALASLAGK